MKHPQSITSLPEAPGDDRKRRMIRYSIAMGIRVVCVFACLFVQGWWLIIPILGAIVLPYVAVILANVASRESDQVLRPGSLLPVRGGDDENRA
jgi:hypothetical protein